MAQLFSASLDVKKITKSKLVEGKKGTYANVTISINDEADQYGNTASIYESQTQEEREAKAPKVYLGNAKLVWSSDGGSTAKQSVPAPAPAPTPTVEETDLPF
jgi:hypothetical protein